MHLSSLYGESLELCTVIDSTTEVYQISTLYDTNKLLDCITGWSSCGSQSCIFFYFWLCENPEMGYLKGKCEWGNGFTRPRFTPRHISSMKGWLTWSTVYRYWRCPLCHIEGWWAETYYTWRISHQRLGWYLFVLCS